MNFIKKGLVTFGTTVALAGAFTITSPIEAEASSWEARTVSEIETDIEDNGTQSQYTIQWGDTLGNIAAAFDVSLNEIAQINEIANKDFIMTGNVLSLSADNKTVSIQDNETKEVKSYDVSEPEVKEVEVPEEVQETDPEEPAQEETTSSSADDQAHLSESEADAKAWIANKESGNDYNAVNPSGKYIGKYQLTNSYLNGDHSPENQERVADEYVSGRYGSWTAAKQFWLENGWY